jgi:acyl carrier protein
MKAMAIMTQEAILDKVRAVLVDALAVDDADVTPESILTRDLGAESIDFLDIAFRIRGT